MELGQEWNQEAVFWVEGDDLFLIPCIPDSAHERVGSFRQRCLQAEETDEPNRRRESDTGQESF